MPSRYAGRVRAPEFPPFVDWVNTDQRVSLGDLKGKIVVLDFWTFC